MTNLLEKSLILGFSIFTLISFLTFITPLMIEINEFNNNTPELDEISLFIEEVDYAINYVLKNNEKHYVNEIYFPKNLNISINDIYIKYDFILEGTTYSQIREYKSKFWDQNFKNYNSGNYELIVFFRESLIDINIINGSE